MSGPEVRLARRVDLSPVATDPGDAWVEEVFGVMEPLIGERPEPRGLAYFTDAAALTPAYGAPPTIICGPGDAEQAHQTDESCSLELLDAATEGIFEIAPAGAASDVGRHRSRRFKARLARRPRAALDSRRACATVSRLPRWAATRLPNARSERLARAVLPGGSAASTRSSNLCRRSVRPGGSPSLSRAFSSAILCARSGGTPGPRPQPG
jgi:hypothetical protein